MPPSPQEPEVKPDTADEADAAPGPGQPTAVPREIPPGHVEVRLSHRPYETAIVPAAEIRALRQQGLLVEDAVKKPAPATGATAKAPAKGAGKDAR
jgi:hypothetical protein